MFFFFLKFEHFFYRKYQYNIRYLFKLIDHLDFIPESDSVGRGPSALLCPGVYYAVKTALYSRAVPLGVDNNRIIMIG